MYLQEILYIHLSIYMNYQQATRWKKRGWWAIAGCISRSFIRTCYTM